MPDQNEGEDQKQSTDTNSKPINQSVAPSAAADHIPSDGAKPPDREKHPTEYDFRKWSLRLTGALVFIGAAYSFFSYQQWQVMNGQLAMTHLDQRAWVAVSEISGKPESGKPYKISVMVKNTGKTFAKRFTGVAGFRAKQLSDPGPDFAKDERENRDLTRIGLIPPNGVFTFDVNVKNGENLTDTDFETVTAPTMVPLVYGKITYWDIFGCEHWTTFCFRTYKDGRFETYSAHNDADNNCGPPETDSSNRTP